MALRPEGLNLTLFRNIDLITISAWMIGLGLVLVIAWKAYRELRS